MNWSFLKKPIVAGILLSIFVAAIVLLHQHLSDPVPESLATQKNGGHSINDRISLVKADEITAPLPPNEQKNLDDQNGRFGKTVRALLKSESRGDLDYALLYTGLNCIAMYPEWDAATAVRNTMSYPGRAVTDEGVIIGNAPEVKRMESFSRAKATCLKMYEGKSLSDAERKDVMLRKVFKDYTSLKKVFDDMKRSDTPEVKSALAAMVDERMLGLMTAVLYQHLDTAPLEKSYGEGKGAVLLTAAIYVIQCRLGGDCGSRGLLTENLCWQHAICGSNLEDGLNANLRERGLDPAAFNRYVDRVVDALQKADPSILRVPDMSNVPIESVR
jgi:hypothetical protein